MQNNVCIPQGQCTGGLVWNGTHCACPHPQIKDSITGGCTYCNTAGRMVSNGVCVCTAEYYPTSTGCSPCIANSQYDATQGRCICKSGYTFVSGSCIASQNCPANSVWNAAVGACQCTTALHYIINGICQPCPSNSQWNGA